MGSLEICYYDSRVKAKAENHLTFHHQHVSDERKRTDEGSSSTTVSSNFETRMLSRGNSSDEELYLLGQLNERLTCLEEEAQIIKQEFCQTIQERKQLMNEIYQQFQIIRCRDQVTPDQFSKRIHWDQYESLTTFHCRNQRRLGLSQVLCQDNSDLPPAIIRDLRPKAVKSSNIRRLPFI